jgi:hypothetical protein
VYGGFKPCRTGRRLHATSTMVCWRLIIPLPKGHPFRSWPSTAERNRVSPPLGRRGPARTPRHSAICEAITPGKKTLSFPSPYACTTHTPQTSTSSYHSAVSSCFAAYYVMAGLVRAGREQGAHYGRKRDGQSGPLYHPIGNCSSVP